MCTSPIHIKRPKSTYFSRLAQTMDIRVHSEGDMYAYDVPCGHCPECKQQKISDYVVRCYDEWIRANEHALFVTLTYAEHHLPILEQCTQDPIFLPSDSVPWEYDVVQAPEYKYISTWYKPHVTKFLKQLQEKLIYYIGTELLGLTRLATINGHRCITPEWREYLSTSPRPLKYLVTCERGSSDNYLDDHGNLRTGTSRPHYHGIFIINDPRLYPHLDYVLELCRDLWIYGRSYNVQIEGSTEVRTPVQCIEYVCKYVFKDLEETTLSCCFADACDKLNRKPFLLVSHGLGSHLLDDVDASVSLKSGVILPSSNGGCRAVNPPRYNVLKKTTFRISGIVSDATIRTKYDKGVFYDGGNSNPFFFLWDEDVHYLGRTIPNRHVKVIKTPLGQQCDIDNRVRKADYYANQLALYQNSLTLKSLWKELDSPLAERNFEDDMLLLHDVSPDDLYLFILNDLYISSDQADNPDTLYECFLLVRDICNTRTIHARKLREIEYKNKLTKAIEAKPELFICTPM